MALIYFLKTETYYDDNKYTIKLKCLMPDGKKRSDVLKKSCSF